MIWEIITVGIFALLVGAGIMKLLLRIKKVELLVDRSERRKYKILNDPDLLLEKLNKNGMMVDDGDGISFAVEEKDGKKQLVQNIKKNVAPKGVSKVSPKTARKDPKEGNNVQTKPKK